MQMDLHHHIAIAKVNLSVVWLSFYQPNHITIPTLNCGHTQVWHRIASRLGVRSRQGLVYDRVKPWWMIASRLGVWSCQALAD